MADPDPVRCGTCDGTGAIDSGGSTPWGEPIDVPCPACAERPPVVVQKGDRVEFPQNTKPVSAPTRGTVERVDGDFYVIVRADGDDKHYSLAGEQLRVLDAIERLGELSETPGNARPGSADARRPCAELAGVRLAARAR